LRKVKRVTKLKISVIIPVFNGGKSFYRCLSSLAEATPQPYEVIVVSDGDTDGSWLVAKDFGAKVIKLPVSGGPARARNLGAQAATGDILFFVDADVEINSNNIDQVATIFERDPELAALIGSYDDNPGAKNFLSQYRNLLHHYTHQTACEEASTFWGACGAIRRDIFLSIGGFDQNYRYPSVEDIELGYRLKAAGYKMLLCKTLQVKHLKCWKAGNLLKADFFYRALPWTELIMRDRKLLNDLNLKAESRLSVMLIYGLAIALLGAFWWSGFVAIAGIIAISLLVLNAPLYRFFLDKRGTGFALKTIPWHWLYFFYSGLAFAIGTASYQLSRFKEANMNLPTAGAR
jgi:GT2 family glycosyltransferase